MKKCLLLIFLWTVLHSPVFAGFIADFQGGPVFTGYNDVRIPGDDGTKFSLSDDLKAQPAWSARTEAGYKLQKYYLGFLITPLRVISNGTLNKNINFNDRIFAAGQELKAKFRFDSYRLMYYYNIYSGNILTFGAGFTAMIWDASISLEGGGVSTEKKNTGFIPIINFALEAKLPADFLIFFGGN